MNVVSGGEVAVSSSDLARMFGLARLSIEVVMVSAVLAGIKRNTGLG